MHSLKDQFGTMVKRAGDLLQSVRPNKIAGLAPIWAVWLALLFAERLVYDRMLWRTNGDFWYALQGADVIFAFLFVSALCLVALIVQREQASRWSKRMKRGVELVRPGKVLILCVSLLFLVFVQGIYRGQSIVEVLKHWTNQVMSLLVHVSLELGVMLTLSALALLLWVIHELIERRSSPSRAIQESIIGSFFAFAAYGCYLVIWQLAIWHQIPDSQHSSHMWAAHFKDSFVYVVIFILYVSPLHRFGLSCSRLSRRRCWQVAVRFAYFAVPIAVLLLALDVSFAEGLRSPLALPDLAAWQRDIIVYHIYIRDFALLVPFIAGVYIWTIWKIVTTRHLRHQAAKDSRDTGTAVTPL
jgi:hypothetical protein